MEIITFQSEGQPLKGTFYLGGRGGERTAGGDRTAGGIRPPGGSPPCAVIVCPGAFEDHHNWSAYAVRLAEQGFSTLVLSFTGHGESGGQRGLVDLRLWAYNIRDAMNCLAHSGYQRFALVGWGLGGSAALLAAAHDQRLVGVVTLAAPLNMQPPLSERVAYSLAAGASKLWKAVKKKPLTLSRKDEYAKLRFALDGEVDAAYKANPRLQAMLAAIPIPESLDSVWMDISQAVVKIKIPVLVIHGQADAVIAVKQAEKLHALLPGRKKLCLVEGAGHALHLDHKRDEVYIQLAKWLKHQLND